MGELKKNKNMNMNMNMNDNMQMYAIIGGVIFVMFILPKINKNKC